MFVMLSLKKTKRSHFRVWLNPLKQGLRQWDYFSNKLPQQSHIVNVGLDRDIFSTLNAQYVYGMAHVPFALINKLKLYRR